VKIKKGLQMKLSTIIANLVGDEFALFDDESISIKKMNEEFVIIEITKHNPYILEEGWFNEAYDDSSAINENGQLRTTTYHLVQITKKDDLTEDYTKVGFIKFVKPFSLLSADDFLNASDEISQNAYDIAIKLPRDKEDADCLIDNTMVIYNLKVPTSKRKKGYGKILLDLVCSNLEQIKMGKIALIYDNNSPWLKDYYNNFFKSREFNLNNRISKCDFMYFER
jgi:hypothetical protein